LYIEYSRALGRVVTVSYGNGESISYTYDAAGNRTQQVHQAAPAPTGTFSANPATITQGNSTR
jgi:YD repeat-containing protein